MKKKSPITAIQLIEELLGLGRYTFTRQEAERRLGVSPEATYMTLRRLMNAGRLVMPRSGFYVIVDPQHRSAGTLPPEWFVHELMAYLESPYYIGLLSAAQLHGSAHHRPQEFQVVIPKRAIRPIKVGNVRIRFFGKGPYGNSVLNEMKTHTGMIKISTPETTAWDLVRYPKSAGGMDNVVTVLSELSDTLSPGKLMETVKQHNELLVAQRLGYILDRLGRLDLSAKLAEWVEGVPVRLLDPSAPRNEASVDRKWRLLVNTQLEPEA